MEWRETEVRSTLVTTKVLKQLADKEPLIPVDDRYFLPYVAVVFGNTKTDGM